MSATTTTTTVTVHTARHAVSPRFAFPANVGPLLAFRGAKAAERCLASFDAARASADVVDVRVEVLDDLDGTGRWHVAMFEYNRVVQR